MSTTALARACETIDQRRAACLRNAMAHEAREAEDDDATFMAKTARMRVVLYTIVLECIASELRARQLLWPLKDADMKRFVLRIEFVTREIAATRFFPADEIPVDPGAIVRAWTSLDLAFDDLLAA